MKILIACEFSGKVRDAFRALGHDAWSCDLDLCYSDERYHIQDDVLNYINDSWDLMVAHPPCTYLSNSGVRWLYGRTRPKVINQDRWEKMKKGALFFKALWDAPINKIAIENPIMHRHASKVIGIGRESQIIQPWQFGHGETKSTCLWLKNLPKLVPTNIVSERFAATWLMNRNKGKARSITYDGIAQAMAQQWGK